MKQHKTISNYWKERMLLNEALTQQEAETVIIKVQMAYIRAYQRTMVEINELLLMAQEEGLKGTNKWRLVKLVNVRKSIEEELGLVSDETQELATAMLEERYVKTREIGAQGFTTSFDKPSTKQVKAVVQQKFHGDNYANRIWKNNQAIALRIGNDLEKMILDGKSPGEITKAIQEDFNVAYYQADRLVRTEASRVFAQANQDTYEEFGITRQEYVAENDSCADCKALDGKVYKVGEGPQLPVHPNCRCVYIPIVYGYQPRKTK